MSSGSVSISTVAISALVSAGVAGSVTLAVNLLLGGPMEVRKQRAVRRMEVHDELDQAVRLALNAVRLCVESPRWTADPGGWIIRYDDEFDTHAAEMLAAYQNVRRHVAGMDGVDPEITVGRALRDAGTFVARVQNFRNEAIGYVPFALHSHRQAIVGDLASAQKLLEDAHGCLGPATPVRWRRLRSLRKRVEALEKEGDATHVKTPINYHVALSMGVPGEHVRHEVASTAIAPQ